MCIEAAKDFKELLLHYLNARKGNVWHINYYRKYLQIYNHINELIRSYDCGNIVIIEFSERTNYYRDLFETIAAKEQRAALRNANIRYGPLMASEGMKQND